MKTKGKGSGSASINSPLMEGLLKNLSSESSLSDKKNGKMSVDQTIPPTSEGAPSLVKSILNILNGPQDSVERLAFETDPSIRNEYASLYKQKVRLIPDSILKRIIIQDDLVASIIQARQNHISAHGRVREDRHGTGLVIEPKQGIRDRSDFTEEKKEELQKRIDRAIEKFSTCGEVDGWKDSEQLGFPEYLSMSTRNALGVGRLATEIIWATALDGTKKFHSFRPIDAGTIYQAAPQKQAAQAVRDEALHLLESIKNKELTPERYVNDEYSYVQVIDGRPVQAFTSKECVVRNFYSVPDVELGGYPVTPIDTMISAVTTHINITTHNKLYFQSGRATRGMLVIKTDDVDESVIARIRQQFNASINSVSNAWRMPVFGVGPEDEITWSAIDSGTRDMEFQYLSDMNARVILSAFQMSPEELPGWSYLSRGTNNQSLCLQNHSKIWTKEGIFTLDQILGEETEAKIQVWTGKAWAEARVFRTGPKQCATTLLKNGSRLDTSPDHRFRSIDDVGELTWVHQNQLREGDCVLVNKRPVEGVGVIPFGNRLLTEDTSKVPSSVARSVLEGLDNPSAWKDGCTVSFLRRVASENNRQLPAWLDDYYCEVVVEARQLDETAEMSDVEVFDQEHAFVADGIITHNSESNNEYILEAARDLGIRPLLKHFEDFINQVLFPLIDEPLSKLCVVKLLGLDAETAEKEAVRLEQDSKLHMDFDEILEKVEKKPVGKEWGGKISFNPDYKAILDAYFTVGEILEHFCGRKDASKDPSLAYRRDPFFFQWTQMQQQEQMAQQQAAAQAQQAQQAPGGAGGQGPSQGGQGDPNAAGGSGGPSQAPSNSPVETEKQKTADASEASASDGGQGLTRALDQIIGTLSKSEAQLPPGRRRLLAQHKKTLEHFVDGLEDDWKEAEKKILGIADHHSPKS